MNETQVMLKVPQEVIDAQVRAAVAAALGRDPEKLIAAVVNSAMQARGSHYDTGKTLFQTAVENEIREVAQQEFKKFLEEQRPAIAKQIREKLGGNAKGLVDKLAEKCADGVLRLDVQAWLPRD